MSEQQEELYDGNTPEDRLVRYKWALIGEDLEEGPARAEALYAAALLALSDLLESHGISDVHQRNIVMGNGLVPGPFGILGHSARFEDWVTELRLLPMRLLDQELPPIETYSDRYLCEVFDLALPDDSEHGTDCLDSEQAEHRCDVSFACPAKIAREVGLRWLSVLVFDMRTYEKVDETAEAKTARLNIKNLSHRLKLYELVDDEALEAVVTEMNRVTNDLFGMTQPPKHKRAD